MEYGKIFRKTALDYNVTDGYYFASVASEIPVLRTSKSGEKYYEVLCQNPESLDMSMTIDGQVSLLFDHKEDIVLGYADQFQIDTIERKTCSRFSFAGLDQAKQYEEEVKSGKWKGVSIGAMPKTVQRSGSIDGIPIVNILTWAPFEVSLVAIPIDTTVGINRSMDCSDEPSDMDLSTLDSDTENANEESTDATPDDNKETVEVTVTVTLSEQVAEEPEEVKEEENLETTELLIEQSSIVEEEIERTFKKEMIMDNQEVQKVELPAKTDFGGEKSLRGYSVAKLVDELTSPGQSLTGLEREVADEMVKKGYKAGSIPTEVITRSLNFTDVNSGKETNVPSNGGYVEAIIAQSALGKLGLMDMGCTNDTIFPRFATISANGPALHTEKAGATTGATVPTDSVTFTANEYTSLIQISRRMLKFAAPGLNNLILRQLTAETQKALEIAAYTTFLSEITKADATAGAAWAAAAAVTAALNLQSLVSADTPVYENGKYLGGPTTLNQLKAMSRNAANLPYPVNVDNTVWDQSCIMTSNMPLVTVDKTPLIYGDFSWAGFSTFGQAPLTIETETVQGGQGMINIVGYSYFDAHILQPKAFAKIVTAK